jgi:hypothetical protein
MLDAGARAKAILARRAAVAAGARFRRDWADAERWDHLARAREMHLPRWHVPPTPRALKKHLQTLVSEPFEGVFGCSPTRLIQLNPATPLRAFVGQMLELAGEPPTSR